MSLLSNAPAPMYLKDAQFRYLLVNRNYEMLSRVSLADLRGKTDYEIFPEPVADLFRRQDEEVIQAGGPLEFEETVPLPDGEFTFITVKFPVVDDAGELCAVGGFCTDITARKQAEQERMRLIDELQSTLREVATLRKILPICSCCRRIRDERGQWSEIESYLRANAELEFSHSMCPACAKKLYGDQKWFAGPK